MSPTRKWSQDVTEHSDALDLEAHVDRRVLGQGADHVVGIEDLDIGAALDVAGAGHARAFLLQHHALDAIGVLAQGDFLDIEDDVGDVLAHAVDRGELVQHAVDLHGLDGGPLQR